MALPTLLLADETTTDDDSIPTSSAVAFTANREVLVLIGSAVTSGTCNEASLSTPSGITFERIDNWGLGGEWPTPRCIQMFRAVPASTVTEVVTISFASAQVQDEIHYQFIQLPAGATLLQYNGSTQADFRRSMDSVTLGQFDNASNGVILAFIKGNNMALNTGVDGMTILGETSGAIYGTHIVAKDSNDLTPSAEWSTAGNNLVHAVGLGFEYGTVTDGVVGVYQVPTRNLNTGGAGTSRVTHSFLRLKANTTYTVWCFNGNNSGPSTVTPSGTGLTFTEMATIINPGNRRTTVWRVRVGGSDFVGAITFTADNAVSQTGWGWWFQAYGNVKTTGTNGADAFGTAVTGSGSTGVSITLAAFEEATNEAVIGGFVAGNSITFTVDSTPGVYHKLEDRQSASPFAHAVFLAHLGAEDTGPAITWSPSTNGNAIAFEVKAAPPAVPQGSMITLIQDE